MCLIKETEMKLYWIREQEQTEEVYEMMFSGHDTVIPFMNL